MEQKMTMKRMSRKWLALVLINLFLCFSAFTQERTITGNVKDVDGAPLIGVSIVVKGTTTGTVTDLDGNYSITVPGSDATLVFSYIGYLKEEVIVGEQSVISSTLVQDITSLDEVVVIGYGVQKKKLVTGATVQVKSEDLTRNNVIRLESALQGLTPGMTVVKRSGQPGSDFNIVVRGIGSVNGSSPLVLIDGVPGNINLVNPQDVESVDILKDAASSAIYGSRAADGVILITTKKGKAGETKITYDFSYGISNASKKIDMLNAQQYAQVMNEGYFNVNPTGRRPPFTEAQLNSILDSTGWTGTDWQEEAYNKNAPSQNHYLGITGGNETSVYSLSLSYNKEEGIFDYNNKSNYERFGFRLNSDHRLKKYLKVGENLTFTHRTRRGLGVSNIYNNFMRGILQASPLIDVYDSRFSDGFGRSVLPSADIINPIADMAHNYNEILRSDDVVGNIYAELEIIKGLKLRTDFGATLHFQNNSNARDSFTLAPTIRLQVPEYRAYMRRDLGYNWDNVLSYDKTMGNHNFTFLVGTNIQDNWYFYIDARADGYLSNEAPVLTNVTTALRDSALGDFGKGDGRYSYFGRVIYNYNEKYLAEVQFRRDASSRFGQNNRYGNFPSFSVGWIASNENFLQSADWLNQLKFRASWGRNGKEPFIPYAFLATVSTSQGSLTRGYGGELGVSPNIAPNPNLKWEAAEDFNIGFDSRFLDGFMFNFDFYSKKSKDWIVESPVAGISGQAAISTTNPLINGGNIRNTGVEFELGYTKRISDILIDLGVNIAYNNNEVLSVPNDEINGNVSVLYNGSPTFYKVEAGYPIGYFWGYKTDGIFQSVEDVQNHKGSNGDVLQTGAQPGDVRRVNTNGDSILNEDDKVMLGNPHPDVVYGFNLALAYKGFDFSMNWQGQTGNQIVSTYRDESRSFYNYTTDILNAWGHDRNGNGTVDPDEMSNTEPRITNGQERNQNWRQFSDLYVHDAGFLRLKSISIGYDFKALLKNAPVERFKLYVSAVNLITLTKYPGLDPENGYAQYYDSSGVLRDAYASGVDIGFYPSPRTYMVGLNVTF